MKVYINSYRSHWLSPYTILERVLFWKDWKNIDYDTDWVERWSDRLLPISESLQWVLNRVCPKVNYVKIDPWDTWSFDHTLAHIILPGLRQLKATTHGSPLVDDEDVPEHLRSTTAPPKDNEWDTDDNHHQRWEWVLEEMIWAFEQKVSDHADSQFFDHSEYRNDASKVDHKQWMADMEQGQSKVKYDREGHAAWRDRKSNGLRLFGKYYEALWD